VILKFMPAATRLQRRTPARPQAEQRVRDIVRAGREVFSAFGFEGATTTEIAARAGVSEATVFTYFRGKRELCERVIADWYDEIIAAMERGLPRDEPIRAQFDYLVRTHLKLFLEQGTGMCALVLTEGRTRAQGFSDAVLPLQRRYTAPLMDVLARGQASGAIRADVPLRLLRPLILGPMEHLLWEAVGTGKPVAIDRTAAQLSALLWQSLAPPGAELAALRQLKSDLAGALAHSDRA
jgi:AcrR family transcriptional regulator